MMSPELPDSESGNPEYQSAGSDEDEDEVPVPDHQEDLVVDHVEGEDTDGSLRLLSSSPAVPLVVTHSHCNTHHHHHHHHHHFSDQLDIVLPLGNTSHIGL